MTLLTTNKGVILFIDDFCEEMGEDIQSAIITELYPTIKKHAPSKVRLVFSSHTRDGMKLFDKKYDLNDLTEKDVVGEQSSNFIDAAITHILGKLQAGRTTSRHRALVQDAIAKRNKLNRHVKIFHLSYLLSRDPETELSVGTIKNQLVGLFCNDLKAISEKFGMGMRDVFVLACYLIEKGVDAFNPHVFLEFSDIICELCRCFISCH